MSFLPLFPLVNVVLLSLLACTPPSPAQADIRKLVKKAFFSPDDVTNSGLVDCLNFFVFPLLGYIVVKEVFVFYISSF